MAKETAPEHPSIRTIRIHIGSTDQEILDVADQVYIGHYEVAQSVLPHRHQDQFIAKLYKEPGQHLVRVGLQSTMGTALSLSRGRWHSLANSLSWARSPSAESRRKVVAKWLRGDSLIRNSKPHIRGSRSKVQQHQSHLPGWQWASEEPPWTSIRSHRHTLLSLVPLVYTAWMSSCTTL